MPIMILAIQVPCPLAISKAMRVSTQHVGIPTPEIRWAKINIFCIWSTFLIVNPNSLKVVITWVQVEAHHGGSSERVSICMIIRIEVKTLASLCQLTTFSPRQQKLASEIWTWGFSCLHVHSLSFAYPFIIVCMSIYYHLQLVKSCLNFLLS